MLKLVVGKSIVTSQGPEVMLPGGCIVSIDSLKGQVLENMDIANVKERLGY
jgi:hypothetical protein